ncbi:hypothetical protein G3I59_37935 [Amycolatopsis rubida]|uniref:Uncharacterized protein n=1 Tax=Amycolatopsis rubida TaxID=112413 RepID=A0ABX0C0M8_9PSEU|nr:MULTISPECIES: hypothetical protein [Amycolatopsis]MYW96240.1 hypothetical protein [Amycolatopsis rubida]NEC61231.1 hypothetical protein [Amycolatopsis rubida]OAP24240.1 hypothetical protein A4R44_05013 [Amycolatopsis sp. M39]
MAGTMPPRLQAYWLGEGLARWAVAPTPYRALVAALLDEDVPANQVHGAAARLHRKHFGKWLGKHDGVRGDYSSFG